jgi:TatD family hydrolase
MALRGALSDTHACLPAVAREFGGLQRLFDFRPPLPPPRSRARKGKKPAAPQEPEAAQEGPALAIALHSVVSVASDPAIWPENAALVAQAGVRGRAFPVYGMHPLYCNKGWSDESRQRLRALLAPSAEDQKGDDDDSAAVAAVAVGEAGLDFHAFPPELEYSTREEQFPVFIAQMELAKELNLPLVLHSREAEAETLELLEAHLPPTHPIHLHCFTDSPSFMHALLAKFENLYVGFAGVVTFPGKSADGIRRAAKECPADRLLLETDAPFMAPVPYRGSTCHPCHVSTVAEAVAAIRGVDNLGEFVEQLQQNAARLYGI